MKLSHLCSIFSLGHGLLLAAKSEAGDPSRNLVSIHSTQCDPSTTDNTIIHAGDSATLEKLASSYINDGYITWSSQASYDNSVYIPTSSDDCKGMGFHWTIDNDKGTIQIAAAVKTDGNNSGWAAIGFSETGGMRGADVVYFTSSSSTIADAYIRDELVHPILDNSQDWELVDYVITDDGYLIFEASRALDTKDPFDRPFVDDTSIFFADHKLIGAWGSSPYMMYHGQNRVHSSIQLFTPDGNKVRDVSGAGSDYDNFKTEMASYSDGSGVIALSNYEIPAVSTYYHEECFTTADLIQSGILDDKISTRYIVGHEIVLKPETAKFMHHAVVYGNTGGCYSYQRSPIIAWAPGEDFLAFPPGVGMKYGGTDSFTSFTIQYHIDNRYLESGKVDTGTGIRLYYTDTPVDDEIGFLQVGDPFVALRGQKVGSGLTKHTFTCPSSCSENTFTSDEITIVNQALHMHNYGQRIVNQVLRDDEVIHESYIDYWDFYQSGGPVFQASPFQFRKGDSFRTTCYFDTDPDTKFGLGSLDEMCMIFILYFPKQNLSTCGPGHHTCPASYDGSTNLSSKDDFGRVFGTTRITPAPTNSPLASPSSSPSFVSSSVPTTAPSTTPSFEPTTSPSATPSFQPTTSPSATPSLRPTNAHSATPSSVPTMSSLPTTSPSYTASSTPSQSSLPTIYPSYVTSSAPSMSSSPTISPSSTSSSVPSTSAPPSSATSIYSINGISSIFHAAISIVLVAVFFS